MPKGRIYLEPQNRIVEFEEACTLQDLLFPEGVEFPCGGKGCCGGCSIQLLGEKTEPHEIEIAYFSAQEIAEGWRLGCRTQAQDGLRMHLSQWDISILDSHDDVEIQGGIGYGIAVDLGTTTIVAQLLDLSCSGVIGVNKCLNPQAAYGADLMSRIVFARSGQNCAVLVNCVRSAVGELVAGLVESHHIDRDELNRIVLVGNSAMHHFFFGLDIAPLMQVPYEPKLAGLHKITVGELGWRDIGEPQVWALPNLGGFVGGDILGGILSTKMHQRSDIVMLVDIGTNSEIVIGNRERILCASAAAGPAFEGGGIKTGMLATHGAIDSVGIVGGRPKCHVIGGLRAKGICGSGLVDAVAVCLDLGWIEKSGKVASDTREIQLTRNVALIQKDIRQLQLAKGAIAAGVCVLLEEYGIEKNELNAVYLAGAFGNYISVTSAIRIGLLEFSQDKIHPVGNTALLGAKLALSLDAKAGEFQELLSRIEHIPLAESPAFQKHFIEATIFP